jgi:fumarate reductase flavoprotein subunit
MSPKEAAGTENLEADIVIIGSGGGLVGALAAAEKGVRNVIVLEKQDALGGNMRFGNGFFACESPVQKREQIIADKDEIFKTFMKWVHWTRVDPRIVRAFLNKSGDTIRWLQEKGMDFEIKMIYPNQRFRVWHWPLNGCGAELVRVLIKNCADLGVKTMLNTSGRRILRDAGGKVAGIVASRDGQEFNIKAGSVIIATGSFCANQELLKQYCTDYYEGMDGFNHPHHTGDGLLMAAEAGAAIAETIPVIHDGPNPDYGPTGPQDKPAYASEPFGGIAKEPNIVWVNKKGRRFVDESAGYMVWESGNAILLQPEKVMYCLFDDRIREDMEKTGLLMGRGWGDDEIKQRTALPGLNKAFRNKEKEKKNSFVKVTDTWEEMAAWIGADPAVLKAEIEEYNSFCDHGYDAIFSKDRRHLIPLLQPPYYAIRCVTSCGETLGGIKINENMEVLDQQHEIIPGLYAVGNIADGWESQTYCAECCGSVFGFAVNSGRIAGENAADYVMQKSGR